MSANDRAGRMDPDKSVWCRRLTDLVALRSPIALTRGFSETLLQRQTVAQA